MNRCGGLASAQRTGVQLRAPEGGRRPTDKLVNCNALLGGPTSPLAISAVQFLANHATKNHLERFLAFLNKGSQGIVDVRLVIRTTSEVSLLSKPVEHIIVETNRDPGLAGRWWQDGTAFGLGEVVVLA